MSIIFKILQNFVNIFEQITYYMMHFPQNCVFENGWG